MYVCLCVHVCALKQRSYFAVQISRGRVCVCMFQLILRVDEQIMSVVPSHLIVEN